MAYLCNFNCLILRNCNKFLCFWPFIFRATYLTNLLKCKYWRFHSSLGSSFIVFDHRILTVLCFQISMFLFKDSLKESLNLIQGKAKEVTALLNTGWVRRSFCYDSQSVAPFKVMCSGVSFLASSRSNHLFFLLFNDHLLFTGLEYFQLNGNRSS